MNIEELLKLEAEKLIPHTHTNEMVHGYKVKYTDGQTIVYVLVDVDEAVEKFNAYVGNEKELVDFDCCIDKEIDKEIEKGALLVFFNKLV